jgi:hypothetical protein
MIRLQVELPVDRDKSGRLIVIDERDRTVLGPFAVAGRSSSKLASANKNPARDPRFRFGDTPTGDYEVRHILKSGKGTLFPAAEFGPHSVVVLEGVSGDAATAEANGRFHFLIQGGKTSASDRLRATAGSLRLANDDLRALVALLRQDDGQVTCNIRERAGNVAASSVDDDSAVDYQDPMALGAALQVALSGRSLSRREAILSGSAGAMTFGLSVTFVGVEAIAPARAYTRLAYGGNGTTYGPGDERQTPSEPSPITGSGGQPIGGAGIQQGPADTPPPPNPTPAAPAYVPPPPPPEPTYTPPPRPTYTPSPPPPPPPPRVYSPPPSPPPSYTPPTPPPPATTAPAQLAPATPPAPVTTPSAPVTPTPPPATTSPASVPTAALTKAQAKKNLDAAYLAIGAKRKAMNALIAQRKATKDPAQQKALDAQIATAKHEVALAGQDFTKAKQAFDSIKK